MAHITTEGMKCSKLHIKCIAYDMQECAKQILTLVESGDSIDNVELLCAMLDTTLFNAQEFRQQLIKHIEYTKYDNE